MDERQHTPDESDYKSQPFDVGALIDERDTALMQVAAMEAILRRIQVGGWVSAELDAIRQVIGEP